MTNRKVVFSLPDNGGRRSGIDRRKFTYSAHIPERRQGLDRRSGLDRRQNISLKEKRNRNRLSASWPKTRKRAERRLALKGLPA